MRKIWKLLLSILLILLVSIFIVNKVLHLNYKTFMVKDINNFTLFKDIGKNYDTIEPIVIGISQKKTLNNNLKFMIKRLKNIILINFSNDNKSFDSIIGQFPIYSSPVIKNFLDKECEKIEDNIYKLPNKYISNLTFLPVNNIYISIYKYNNIILSDNIEKIKTLIQKVTSSDVSSDLISRSKYLKNKNEIISGIILGENENSIYKALYPKLTYKKNLININIETEVPKDIQKIFEKTEVSNEIKNYIGKDRLFLNLNFNESDSIIKNYKKLSNYKDIPKQDILNKMISSIMQNLTGEIILSPKENSAIIGISHIEPIENIFLLFSKENEHGEKVLQINDESKLILDGNNLFFNNKLNKIDNYNIKYNPFLYFDGNINTFFDEYDGVFSIMGKVEKNNQNPIFKIKIIDKDLIKSINKIIKS